jgi:hypothetical protein
MIDAVNRGTYAPKERPGHANISVTLDIYSQVTAGLHSNVAEEVADLIFGGAA